jgi:peptidoglycan/xylan/chitin deacetylase (PgdA/CDA1 family)
MLITSNYHYIKTSFEAKYPSIFGLTPDLFKHQLNQLTKIGTFVNQKQLLENREHIMRSDEKFLLVTFDDGFKEQFEIAKPILDDLKIPAIYFINSINHLEKKVSMVHKIQLLRSVASPEEITKEIENYDIRLNAQEYKKAITHYSYDTNQAAAIKYLLNFKLKITVRDKIITRLFDAYFNELEVVEGLYMTKKQLNILGAESSLGNHTHSHLGLGLYDAKTIYNEIKLTKKFLEDTSVQEIKTISYPYGSPEACMSPVADFAKKLNHEIGFTMNRGISQKEPSFLMLNRFSCSDLPGGKNEKLFLDETPII